jgi:two-component system invasion response regulator UvrY
MINVLIADDHPVVRQGIRQIVAQSSDIAVMGEATTAQETKDQVTRLLPDIVLLDLTMPGSDGLQVLKDLKRERPQLPIIILTMHSEDQFAVRALKAGAAGYLTKESAPEELVGAIRRVMGGGHYVSPWLAEKLANHLGPDIDRPLHETLSDREYQVLRLIATGKSTRDISEVLSLSIKTVSTYRARLLEKMRMKTSAELAAYVVRNRLADDL